MKCIKAVVNINCRYCCGKLIRFGKTKLCQRYRCKDCNKTQLHGYVRRAYHLLTDNNISTFVKEGCGIRSIGRILGISTGTVMARIMKIAARIIKPAVIAGGTYEVDELRTYVKNKKEGCWVMYAVDKHTGVVMGIEMGHEYAAQTRSSMQRRPASEGYS